MGKYTRKPKPSGAVSAMDAAQSSFGVRTRAKTLALQQRLSSSADYLELRSRRLQKPPLPWHYLHNSRKPTARKRDCVCADEGNAPIDGGMPIGGEPRKEEEGCVERGDGDFGIRDLEIGVSFGENNSDIEVRDRSTRESTPCSFIRNTDNIPTPGSSTKQRSPAINQGDQNVFRDAPTAQEIDELFTRAEKSQQNCFIEKYNFDIVNDSPLPGRFEWVRVTP